jgi:hypothetical protein
VLEAGSQLVNSFHDFIHASGAFPAPMSLL